MRSSASGGRRTCSFAIALWAVTLGAAVTRADGFVFIRHEKGSTATVRAAEVREMLTGRTKQWKAGAVVQVVLPPESGPAMKWLAESVFGVTEKVLLTKIRQEVFKGEMRKPLTSASDADSIELVRTHAGGIGAVPAEAARTLPDGVAILTVE